jgi:Ni,Fe-hydrogenase I small subunit
MPSCAGAASSLAKAAQPNNKAIVIAVMNLLFISYPVYFSQKRVKKHTIKAKKERLR